MRLPASWTSCPAADKVMLKLTIPTEEDFYAPLVAHGAVVRVVALSGGYSTMDACEKLSRNHGMIASFSRALAEQLRDLHERCRVQREHRQDHRPDLRRKRRQVGAMAAE